MFRRSQRRWTPLLCTVCAYLTAVVLIWPVLQSGITDDWSIVRTAQTFAETGRIHYNAWEAPMLLWQVWLVGAVFKLFGFSYLLARLVAIAECLLATILLQRCMVRSGLTEWNAAFGTLSVVLCPIFLGFSVTLMTDDVGLLALICCFYGCLRAVQAAGERSSAGWLCFAAITNILISSARQIDFIGVLVLLPCTVYLLRRKGALVLVGAVLYVLSLGGIFAMLHWYNHQPYILPQPFLYHSIDRHMLRNLVTLPIHCILDTGLFLTPVCLLFLPAWRRVSWRVYICFFIGSGLFAVGQEVLYRRHDCPNLLSPFFLIGFFFPQTFDNTFINVMMPPKGVPPNPLPALAQWIMTGLSLLAVLTVLAAILLSRKKSDAQRSVTELPIVLPWNSLLVLTLPLVTVYMLLLLPRGLIMTPPDRYLLGFLPFGVMLLLRFYARHYRGHITRLAWTVLVGIGLYGTLTTHDAFSTFRASLGLTDEVLAAGVPRQQIDGGFEYNADTEILLTGRVYAPGTRLPDGTLLAGHRPVDRGPCGELFPLITPDVHAIYALSWPTSPCAPVPGFAPVSYTTWLPPFSRTIFVVRAQPDQWIPLAER